MESDHQPFSLSPQLSAEVERVCSEFHGQLDDLYQAIGLLVAGQLFGWRVMRLVSTRSNWRIATDLFGDLKKLMPERGPLHHRSIGLQMADQMDEYWNIVKGVVKVPQHERRAIVDSR